MSDLVKLYLYQHEPHETVIDIFEAKSWEDFLIIKVSADALAEDLENLSLTMTQYAGDHPEQQIILCSENTDLEFYGVKAVDE